MKHFITLLPSIFKTLFRQTDLKRWRDNISSPPPWDDRNAIIARHIDAGGSVLDLGAGAQTLPKYLKSRNIYTPCDLIKASPDCIVCNFNQNQYPQIERQFDFVICSGLLEYIKEPLTFLKRIKPYGGIIILSYCPIENYSFKTVSRIFHGWFNHLSRRQLEEIFTQAGYTWQLIDKWQDQLIYRLKP